MLQQRVVFAEDLHVIFNKSLKVKRKAAAKDHICGRFSYHIQWIIESQMQCCCEGSYLRVILNVEYNVAIRITFGVLHNIFIVKIF